MAIKYPDYNTPMIPELRPNLGLISLRNTFGIDPRYLLADYNQYYTNMNDNMPVEKIDDGIASIDTTFPIYAQDNDGGNNFIQYTNKGAPGYTKSNKISAPMSQEYNLQDPTVMKISNFDEMFGTRTFTDNLGNVRTVPGEERFTLPEEKKGILQNIKEKGIGSMLKNLIPGRLFATLLSGILPEESPQMKAAKSFYGDRYGLTSSGSVASGIMAGYNPVSGGLLNMLTGGAYGSPPNVGLQRAYQQRINMIKNTLAKKYADGDYSGTQLDEKLAELEKLKAEEQMEMEKPTIDRARETNRDVYREAERQGFTGPGGGFSTSGREGAFSSKSGRGRQDY